MNRRFLAATAIAALFLTACDDTGIQPVPDTTRPGVFVLGQKYAADGSSSLQKIQDGGIVDATPATRWPATSSATFGWLV